MIYYVCLDNGLASGGVKTLYRHVEILNAAGIPASMLHEKPWFTAATWFQSTAPIAYTPTVRIQFGDVLVWPEILRRNIESLGVTSVIFNQNVHYTWRGGWHDDRDYAHGAKATMVLTEFDKQFLGWAVPGHPVSVIRHGIDPKLFGDDGRVKEKQIAFMPRKHADEAEAVFGWLRSGGHLKDWGLAPIDKMSEVQTAETLKDSMVFFAFGYPEGGTLPPFEALAAGCMVIGYGGFASDQDLTRCGGLRIPSGDTCRFARAAADWLPKAHLTPRGGLSKGVLDYFSLAQERESLLRFFKELKNE